MLLEYLLFYRFESCPDYLKVLKSVNNLHHIYIIYIFDIRKTHSYDTLQIQR